MLGALAARAKPSYRPCSSFPCGLEPEAKGSAPSCRGTSASARSVVGIACRPDPLLVNLPSAKSPSDPRCLAVLLLCDDSYCSRHQEVCRPTPRGEDRAATAANLLSCWPPPPAKACPGLLPINRPPSAHLVCHLRYPGVSSDTPSFRRSQGAGGRELQTTSLSLIAAARLVCV